MSLSAPVLNLVLRLRVAALGYTLIAVFDTINLEYNYRLIDFGSIALFIMITICSAITLTHSRI
jgi:hypothetical protein